METMVPVTFPDDVTFWFPLVTLFHPSLLSLLPFLTINMVSTNAAFSFSFEFSAGFDCSVFRSFTKIVDDSDEADMVKIVLISWCILVDFVMVKL